MELGELRFLVVEDHEFQRNMIVRMLTRLQAKSVQAAADGRAALEILRKQPQAIDIIISDLEMPSMDGMELIRHIGTARFSGSLIIASALDRALLAAVETMTRAYGITLLGTIEKPISEEALLDIIGRATPPRGKSTLPKAGGLSFALDEIVQGIDDNEFEPFFQPKVELATWRVKGAEALARWRHPQEGIVAPYAFIKTLEDNGMIDKLMWIMLRKAASFCGVLSAAGKESTVSVNLSLKSLVDVDLAARITALVRSYNVEPRQLVLEVTESAATTDTGKALENLTRLRMKGFGLSIDDYGTGYSSMQQLTRIPFTELKIDRTFVTNAGMHESAKVILGSSLQMAKKLKIAAVAEGVETQADWDLLRELECDLGQGYFIGKPMERDQFLGWIRNWEQAHAVRL